LTLKNVTIGIGEEALDLQPPPGQEASSEMCGGPFHHDENS